MDKLELKIPPVAVFIVALVLMNRLSHLFVFASITLPLPAVVFTICFVLSGIVGLWGIHEFRKVQTTVNPTKPENASCVVDSGIYRYSRNPMYLGLLLLLFATAYWQQNILSFAIVFLFVWFMNRLQILPEERVLERLFGEEYVDYKQRVRRWI
ncbi:methyltransferase family protein [Vibrio sp. S12_S33]|uniref:methyltransferase family protein n=1 Tax=Vibrio sp. S12_S33 TaxID=2720223 RepID=UPI001785CBE9|nr:isoprenylcysteine carboxylmethyltransferase family protein [Vibrio sp. S12_S33]MBD1565920.1 isoprenylcysteine carboxylmethyltransferase family protein [Vibrio sp. S12_S33]